MFASARNQFAATINGLRAGPTFDEVVLTACAGGHSLVAAIMAGTGERLALRMGGSATVLVNANSVMLVTDEGDDWLYSPRNQFTGTVTELRVGSVSMEVELSVPPCVGDYHQGQPLSLVAVVRNQSAEKLRLEPGKTVTALFHASSVVLATARRRNHNP